MTIQRRDSSAKGSFVALEGDVVVGTMTYSWAGDDTFIIRHTEVAPSFSGKGLGKQLVSAAVDHARANGLKVVVRCPFAKKVFERNPEFQDVLR